MAPRPNTGSTGNIARMYQQRVPTAPSTPKPASTPARTGPRGITIQDVAQVASGQQPVRPATQWPAEPSAPAPLDVRKVYEGLIGGPASTYGKKYGGMPSASYFADLVRGETYNSLLAGQMAAQEAARLAQPAEKQYAYDIDPTRGGVAGKQVQENRRIMNQPVTDYASAMARMNAVRGTGDYQGNQMLSNAQVSVTPTLETQRQRALQASGAARQQELANLIGGLTPSEIMQQIAVQRYGYDPALAAGLFPATEDLSYQNMLNDAYNAQIMRDEGIDPNATTAEIILREQGPEALRQYQRQQADYAMNGTPTQQLSAEKNLIDSENAMFDESVRTQYGFDPTKVANVEADYVRDLVMNPTFTGLLEQARQDIVDGGDPLEIASQYASQYMADSNDALGARALGEILASFDLEFFG